MSGGKTWVICEEAVLHDKRITCTDLRVYLHLKYRYAYLNLKGKDYFESFSTISEHTGVSERSISTSVKRLQELGYIEVERRARSTYVYRVL